MHSSDLHRSLPSLFGELVHGTPDRPAFVLNRGDAGLLKSLDALTAREASQSTNGGATVAAHCGAICAQKWSTGMPRCSQIERSAVPSSTVWSGV